MIMNDCAVSRGVSTLIDMPISLIVVIHRVSLAFLLSSSGIVDLVKAEATLEESVEVKVPKKKAKPAAASDAKKNETESSEGV